MLTNCSSSYHTAIPPSCPPLIKQTQELQAFLDEQMGLAHGWLLATGGTLFLYVSAATKRIQARRPESRWLQYPFQSVISSNLQGWHDQVTPLSSTVNHPRPVWLLKPSGRPMQQYPLLEQAVSVQQSAPARPRRQRAAPRPMAVAQRQRTVAAALW